MRTFFYALAIFCSGAALILFLYPIVTGLPKIRDGFTAIFTFGIVVNVAPVALALAVISTEAKIIYRNYAVEVMIPW